MSFAITYLVSHRVANLAPLRSLDVPAVCRDDSDSDHDHLWPVVNSLHLRLIVVVISFFLSKLLLLGLAKLGLV